MTSKVLAFLFAISATLFGGGTTLASESGAPHSGGGMHFVNFYEILLSKMGFHMHDGMGKEWQAVPGALFITLILLLAGFKMKSYVNRKLSGDDVAPDGKFSINSLLDMFGDFLYNLTKDQIGEKHYRPYIPLIMAIFIFIFFSNIIGMVPGFTPPTGFISMNLAIGLISFGVYNFAGIKEHGFGYLKQFTGPMLILAPLFICIEFVSHVARPASLAVRLMLNLFGDHLVLAIFTDLTWVFVPALLLFFGLLVAFIQSYVFSLLTGVYIGMAVSHDH